MNLSAAAGLVALPAQSYDKPGTSTYRRHVPAAAYQYETVPVDFTLGKSYSPRRGLPGTRRPRDHRRI